MNEKEYVRLQNHLRIDIAIDILRGVQISTTFFGLANDQSLESICELRNIEQLFDAAKRNLATIRDHLSEINFINSD